MKTTSVAHRPISGTLREAAYSAKVFLSIGAEDSLKTESTAGVTLIGQ